VSQVAEAKRQVEIAEARLAVLRKRADAAQAAANDPDLCAADNGAALLVQREAESIATRKLVSVQEGLTSSARKRLETAEAEHTVAVEALRARLADEHRQRLLSQRDAARGKLVEALGAAAADFAIATASVELGQWRQTLSAPAAQRAAAAAPVARTTCGPHQMVGML
jgi:hypothetical protein